MEDIYMLADPLIAGKIGERLKSCRLKQNITQQSLADEACISVSSVKKIEKGEINSFDSFLRLLCTLGLLEVLLPLVEEEQLSPTEYYKLVNEMKAHRRQRAAGAIRNTQKAESEW